MSKLVLILVGVFAVAACVPGSASARTSGIDGYYQWFEGCLRGLKSDMPTITASAEAAANLFVNQDYHIGPWGDPAFVSEFRGRAGGLMPVSYLRPNERVADTIILVAPNQDNLESDLVAAARMKRPDNWLILFARPEVIKLADKAGAKFDAVVDTHAAEHGGLLQGKDGKWIIPTDRAASMTAMWAWTAEFVGACTRLGKMPVMWQSLSCPGSAQRARKYQKVRFHDGKPQPVEPGYAGKQYLDVIHDLTSAIYSADRDKLDSIAGAARSAIGGGRTFYVGGQGHATEHPQDRASDPGIFKFLVSRGPGVVFQPGDYLFCVGYDAKYQEEAFGKFSRECREAGGKVGWAVSTYGQREIPCVMPGETLVDQRWALGDAAVTMPGYDIKILPPSGVISEVLIWMVASEAIHAK